MLKRMLAVCIGLLLLALLAHGQLQPVTLTIDGTKTYQTMDGFGCAHMNPVSGVADAQLATELRTAVIKAVYQQVHITMGDIEMGGPIEAPADATDLWANRRNDDDDPYHLNPAGFNFNHVDQLKKDLLDAALPYGFDNYYFAPRINIKWENPWLKDIRDKDYQRYLAECGEHVAAAAIHMRDTFGLSPRYLMLFNEPTTGNGEAMTGNPREIVDIVKAVGARLRKEGFKEVKFVVPGEETEDRSLQVATAILEDPDARAFVGAIAYHPYPYGSTYAAIRNIMRSSGIGTPNPDKVAIRGKLRDLGTKYGVPLWMTEVSNGEMDIRTFPALLGRAIHIHDELVYANASAYFGMFNVTDTVAVAQHAKRGGDPNIFNNEGTIVMVDVEGKKVYISNIGYAIGHYARWLSRGAVRIDAVADNPQCLVTAFNDPAKKRLTLVLINPSDKDMLVNTTITGVKGLTTLNFTSEQSLGDKRWEPLAPFTAKPTAFTITLPAKSVTTLGADVK